MKKIYAYITLILSLLLILVYTAYYFISLQTNQNNLKHMPDNSIISSIGAYIMTPLIESRIDFQLENTGLITLLQQRKYDNKIISIEEIQIGEGQEVICGQDVSIKINNTEEQIKIGQGSIKALNVGIIGMKEGGIRKIRVPKNHSERLTGIINTEIEYEVTLQQVLSEYPPSVENLLKFETIIGNKKAIMCGDQVNLEYKVRNVKGKYIKNEKTSFKVGERNVPLAIELGVIEMVPGSNRTIISPPDLLDENFSQEEVSIIDLSIN